MLLGILDIKAPLVKIGLIYIYICIYIDVYIYIYIYISSPVSVNLYLFEQELKPRRGWN